MLRSIVRTMNGGDYGKDLLAKPYASTIAITISGDGVQRPGGVGMCSADDERKFENGVRTIVR